MNDSNDSTMSSLPELTEDSLDETLTEDEPSQPLSLLPSVRLNMKEELKTLTWVASRNVEEDGGEDETLADLDNLQLDLERLLSQIVLMRRGLRSSLEEMSQSGRPHSPNSIALSHRRKYLRMKKARLNSYVKRKRAHKINVEIVSDMPCVANGAALDNKTPVKSASGAGTDGKTPVRLNGTTVNHAQQNGGKTPKKNHTKEGSRSSLSYIPKNNSAEVFWQSMRPYVDDVTDQDVKLIQDMIETCQSPLPDIPELGEHYSRSITDPVQLLSITSRLKKFKPSPLALEGLSMQDSLGVRLKVGTEEIVLNNNLHLPNTLIERIVSVLNQCNHNGDENELMSNLASIEGVKQSYPPALNRFDDIENQPSQEMVQSTALTEVDHDASSSSSGGEEDEVLAEIIKCRSELSQVCTENSAMLNTLLVKLRYESRRAKLVAKLNTIDAELCGIVRKLNAARSREIMTGTPATPGMKAASLLRSPAPHKGPPQLGSAQKLPPHPATTPAATGVLKPNSVLTGHDGHNNHSNETAHKTEGHPMLPDPLRTKICRYRKRTLLYLKMRDCVVNLLHEFNRDPEQVAKQFQSSMDIDAFLLKHIIQDNSDPMTSSPVPTPATTCDVTTAS
uniref:Transcriptional adapter 3-A n=1 Tax=Cacopsylla melanoneura TaxID=428564 RepID=A0A8D8MCM5_9HEMI